MWQEVATILQAQQQQPAPTHLYLQEELQVLTMW